MENTSVPFMEHPFHPIRIKHLSDNVKSRIRNGHQVRISPLSVGAEGEGLPLIVHSNRFNNISKVIKQGKGIQIRLSPEELHHNRSVGGEGIFGKKADKLMKKAGVKKLAYAVGSAVKPFAQKAITSAGAYFGGPLGALASQTANDYLDRPEEYQKAVREGIKDFKNNKPTGNFRDKAIDMLADKIKEHTGEDIGVLDKAGASKAMADRMSAELAKRVGGVGLYAGRGLGLGAFGRRREYHSIGGRHQMMGQGVPALVSQPFGANYQFRAFLPPAYQHLHK